MADHFNILDESSGGGDVSSVAGRTGAVTLTVDDVSGADRVVRMPAPSGGDDTSVLQAVITGSSVGDRIMFRASTYLLTAPLVYLPGRAYAGEGHAMAGAAGGAVLKQANGANITNAASLSGLFVPSAWSTNAVTCDNPVLIENIAVDGNKANNSTSTACGIAVVNYWSRVQDCYVSDTKKHGILLTDTTANGTNVITNSASENRVLRNKIVGCVGDGIHQVCANNISNQDGYCDDNLISDITGSGIYYERGSGWSYRRNHLYGIGVNGLDLSNCYATLLIGNEVEDFGTQATAAAYYAGYSVVQLSGRETVMFGNFAGCAEPSEGVGGYQYFSVASGVSQTTAGIIAMGNVARGPASATTKGIGLVADNRSGGTLTVHLGGNAKTAMATQQYIAVGVVALTDDPETLYNKTIAAGSNTITGITSSNVAAGSVDGTAGTASMRTLGTGAAQALAGTHAATASGVHGATGSLIGTSDSQTLTNKTIAAGSNTITGLTSGNMAAGSVDGAAATASVRTLSTAVPGGDSGTAAAAGAALTASSSGHLHPRTYWTPADRGYATMSCTIGEASNTSVLPNGGLVHYVRVHLPVAQTVTNIHVNVTTVGTLLTTGQCFAALFTSAGTWVKSTADQATAWLAASPTVKTMALTSTYAAAAGDFYVGLWCQGTTGPTFARATQNAGMANAGLAAPNFMVASSDTGTTTTAPSSIGTQTSINTLWWVALS